MQHVVVNGEDVAYQASGTGPVLLLVHGMAGGSTTWARVMPALSERCTVVAPDLLGHGASAKPRGEYSRRRGRPRIARAACSTSPTTSW